MGFIHRAIPPILFAFQFILVMAQKSKVLHIVMLLLLLLFFFSYQATRFHSSWIHLKFWSIHIFSDYIKNKYKHTKSLTAASDCPQGNRTYGVIYMTKKNHSQELRSCITKLQSFYKVGLFVAVSTLCVPLYKAFPIYLALSIYEIRSRISYIESFAFPCIAQVWLTSSVILTNKGFWKQDKCIYCYEWHERSAAFINLLTS